MPSPTLLTGNFSSLSTPIIDPLTGLPFPGNIIPSSRFSNFAKTLAPTVPAPNDAGANNYQSDQGVQRRRRHGDDPARSGDQPEAQPVRAVHVLQGRPAEPVASSATRTSRRPGATSPSAIRGWSRRRSSTRSRFGYNYAYHLNAPISLDGRNWVGDIGLQNLAGGTDPIDYGRPGFTMTGFSGNGEGGITQGATENIFSVSNATSWVKGRHNIRFGIQAQFRKFEHLTEVPPRGGFTFNGQFTRQPGRRLPARLLLDLHRRIRQLALELQVADLRAVHRRQLAGLAAR